MSYCDPQECSYDRFVRLMLDSEAYEREVILQQLDGIDDNCTPQQSED